MSSKAKCGFIKLDGTSCKAAALPTSASGGSGSYCYFHSPDHAEQRAEARKKGGRARSRPAAVLPAETPDVRLADIGDVTAALGTIFNDVRRGRLDAKVGNCLTQVCATLLRAIEGHEQEDRLTALEDAVKRLSAQKQNPLRLVEGERGTP